MSWEATYPPMQRYPCILKSGQARFCRRQLNIKPSAASSSKEPSKTAVSQRGVLEPTRALDRRPSRTRTLVALRASSPATATPIPTLAIRLWAAMRPHRLGCPTSTQRCPPSQTRQLDSERAHHRTLESKKLCSVWSASLGSHHRLRILRSLRRRSGARRTK